MQFNTLQLEPSKWMQIDLTTISGASSLTWGPSYINWKYHGGCATKSHLFPAKLTSRNLNNKCQSSGTGVLLTLMLDVQHLVSNLWYNLSQFILISSLVCKHLCGCEHECTAHWCFFCSLFAWRSPLRASGSNNSIYSLSVAAFCKCFHQPFTRFNPFDQSLPESMARTARPW